jgi:hypothetical protein
MKWFPRITMFLSRQNEVVSHWYVPVENLRYSSTDFYNRIMQELEERRVPGLKCGRIIYNEGGFLDGKREYLRLRRERQIFDICAAPFGTSYFFSFRLIIRPVGTSIWELLLLVGLITGTYFGVGLKLGFSQAYVAAAILAMILCLLSPLIRIPVLTAFYEAFLRPETFYREDTRLMYLTTVEAVAKYVVEDVVRDKGKHLYKVYERTPVGGKVFSEEINKVQHLPVSPTLPGVHQSHVAD